MTAVPLNQMKMMLYENVLDTTGRQSTIGECLGFIRSDAILALWPPHLRPLYQQYLASGSKDDKAKYDDAKKGLPAMTISGTFTKRGIAGLETYSGVIQVDLDKLQAGGFDIADLKQRVSGDPHVAFAFVSPSGDGLKIGVRVASGLEDHTEAFLGMQRYWLATYGIRPDDSCKDVSRLCFLSSDPDLFVNDRAIPLDWRAWPEPATPDDEGDIEDTNVALPLDAFPAVIQQLASAYAEVYMVAPALPAVSALSVMSAAFGNSVNCTGAVNGKTTPCNMYTAIAAPSAYGKGVVGHVAKPLLDYSVEMGRRFEEQELPRLKASIAIASAQKAAILGTIKKGGLSGAEMANAKAELCDLEANINRCTFEASQPPPSTPAPPRAQLLAWR